MSTSLKMKSPVQNINRVESDTDKMSPRRSE
jgi:hypothetical protein